jgi:thymidylate synthase (FAD)
MTAFTFTRKVLDHGFVTLRNLAGPTRRTMDCSPSPGVGDNFRPFDADDTDPANAARMSFDHFDANRPRETDLHLCDYLMRNWHSTPFEMIECWIEMKLPIFVARQFVRHRTVSINEVSARYVTLPAEWYIPQVVGAKPTGGAKQGQSAGLDPQVERLFKERLNRKCRECYDEYTDFIELGVAAEHARMFLHLNHYTHWLWKQDFHNMMHFLSLRDHSHAQVEARAYAQAIDALLREQLPHSMSLYDKYRKQEG